MQQTTYYHSKGARIATIQDGKPLVVPVWYHYDGTNILVSTTKGARKAKNLQTNPNVSITIDDVEGKLEDISFLNAKAVIIEGTGELKDDINNSLRKKCMKGMLVRMLSVILWFDLV